MCKKGYYVAESSDGITNLCTKCPDSCVDCESADSCTGCAVGYYLPFGEKPGPCEACSSPCTECVLMDFYCTACEAGYTQKVWKCQIDKYVRFEFTLNTDETGFITNMDSFIGDLLEFIGENREEIERCTLEGVAPGSVLLTGSVDASDNAAASSKLSSASSLGGVTITGSSTSVQGESTSSSEDSNTGLIVGLTVGLAVLLGSSVLIQLLL